MLPGRTSLANLEDLTQTGKKGKTSRGNDIELDLEDKTIAASLAASEQGANHTSGRGEHEAGDFSRVTKYDEVHSSLA